MPEWIVSAEIEIDVDVDDPDDHDALVQAVQDRIGFTGAMVFDVQPVREVDG